MERSPERMVDLSMVSKGGLDHFSKEDLLMMKRFRTLESREEKPKNLAGDDRSRIGAKGQKERARADPEGNGLSKE